MHGGWAGRMFVRAMGVSRREVLFSGTVQGVFFRARTRDVAQRFAVTGYVRNLADGRVELVAEGEPGELDAFVAAVQEAMAGCIRDLECTDGAAEGRFAGFEIRF